MYQITRKQKYYILESNVMVVQDQFLEHVTSAPYALIMTCVNVAKV